MAATLDDQGSRRTGLAQILCTGIMSFARYVLLDVASEELFEDGVKYLHIHKRRLGDDRSIGCKRQGTPKSWQHDP
jgi:hypothetical protein